MRAGRRILNMTGVGLTLLCGVSACDSKRAVDPDALKIQWPSEPVALNPWQAEDGAAMKVLHNAWELWVRVTPVAGKPPRIEGRLAERWQWDATGKQLTVWIRHNARWSDGAPVTAEQARDGILKTLAPATGSKMAVFFSEVESVNAIAPKIFNMRFRRKIPYGVMLLSLLASAPYRKDLAESDGTWPPSAPSTGVYRIENWERGKRVQLSTNPYFWGKSPHVKRVHFEVVTDEATALNLFETGRLQVVSRVPASDIKRLREQGLLHIDPYLATYYLAFRMDAAGGRTARDVQLRRDLSAAIDRKGLVQALDSGDAPSSEWVPRELLGIAQSTSPLTQLSGKKWGGTLAIDVDGSSRNRLILEKVQQDWKSRLGISLEIHSRDWKSHIRKIESDPAALYRFGWLAPFADPVTHLMVFMSQSRNNYTRWKSSAYDVLVRKVQELPLDSRARTRTVQKASRILTQEAAVVIPLFQYKQTHLVRPEVKNFNVDTTGVIRVEDLIWK